MVYSTPTTVRLLTNLSTTDISDANLTSIIALATRRVNEQLNYIIHREKVVPIDNFRENDINGTTTRFYVQNWEMWFIGDLTNNGAVDTSDVEVTQRDADGNETSLTVSAVTATRETNYFDLSSAPASGVELFVTYARAPVDQQTPDVLIQLATDYMAAAIAFTRVNALKDDSLRIGRITIKKNRVAQEFMSLANAAIDEAKRRAILRAGEAKNIVQERDRFVV